MAKLGVRIACRAGGKTLVTLCLSAQRATDANDKAKMRCVRRRSGYADKTLPNEMDFTMPEAQGPLSWVFIDENVPADGDWDYIIQIYRKGGSGTFYEITCSAVHMKA